MATTASATGRIVGFDCYEADLACGELRKRGIRIRLREQSFQVLATLLERPGQLVTREELRQKLWRGAVFVEFENNLNAVVAHLREKLGDSAERPRFIETLPKRGYRFIAEVWPLPLPEQKEHRPRLAVLPFVNLSGDPTQAYFSDAMTDEVITALVSLAPKQLAVIAKTTAMRYKGSHKDIARVGRELNLDYVVEGSVRRMEERVVMNVQLIQTADEAHLFAQRYEAELRQIFRLQRRIAEDIAIHINAPAVAEEVADRLSKAGARGKPTENLGAYNEYLQGRYLLERLTPDALGAAKQHFENAIAMDAEFALAHVALADLYSWLGYIGYVRPRDAYAAGLPYALRGAESGDTLAEAHAVLAEYHKQVNFDWAAAKREMAKALELGGSSPFVRFRNAVVLLMPLNQIDGAVDELRCALELDPLAGATRTWFGIMFLLAQEYDRAIQEAKDLLELEPNSPWPPFIIGIAYRQKYYEATHGISAPAESSVLTKWAEEAIAGHIRAMELAPGTDYFLGWLGLALGACDRKAEARSILGKIKQSQHYILPTSFTNVYIGLEEYDAAIEWFDRAIEERDQVTMPILSYAHFDPLRSHPRFAGLLRKMRLG